MKNINYMRKAFMLLVLLASIVQLNAQIYSGTIKDSDGETLIGANIIIEGTNTGTTTDLDGKFQIKTDKALPFNLLISYTGYPEKTIQVTAQNQKLDIVLESGIMMEEIVIEGIRGIKKAQDAPSSISQINTKKLEATPQTDAVRNLINVPGVQIQQQSANRINIEMRASNGLFGTSVFPIMDYRSLVAPGIGTFSTDAVGLNTIDLKTIQVVRGPGSALYGPGVTSGVVHFITKNPIDHPGTTVQLGGGELNTFLSAVRHAWSNSNKTFGYKINAAYNRGNEFTLDGSEGTYDANNVFTSRLDEFERQVIQPVVTNGVVDLTKPGEVLLTENDLDPDGDGNMMQDDWANMTINTSLEFRPQDDLTLFLSGGFNQASSVFYNDLGEGLSQSKEFWGQARMQKAGLFAQLFYVNNDGGDKDKPTLLYTTGNRSPVGRQQLEGQLQYNFDIKALNETNFIVGADYRLAINETLNLVYGRNEDDDNYQIMGAYAQAEVPILKNKLNMVLAGRYDDFNFLNEGFFSPRVAFVYKVNPANSVRATFNRAGSPPSGLQMNIDFPVNAPIPGVFDFWLAGMNDLHTFDNNTIEFLNQDVVSQGVLAVIAEDAGLSPDDPALEPTRQLLDALAANLPDALPNSADAIGAQGLSTDLIHNTASGFVLQNLEGTPLYDVAANWLAANAPGGTTGLFYGVNAFDQNTPLNQLIPTVEPSIAVSNTYEIGYKGLIKDKLSLSVDVYHVTRKGFSNFTQIAPLISLVNADVSGLNDIATGLAGELISFGMDAESAQGLAELYGTIANVVPSYFGTGTVESSRMPQDDGILHVAAGYRIFPEAQLQYLGSDIGIEYYVNNDLSLFGNFSWVSKTQFDAEDLGEPKDSPLSFSLNVPATKFRLGAFYTPASGIRGNISFQHDDGFFSNTGAFGGDVPAKNLVDIGIGYKFKGKLSGLAIDLTAINALDSKYRAFNNMPEIGRRVLGKITYTFGDE